MVHVPSGSFVMGSPENVGEAREHPQHRVHVPAFSIGKYAVTFEEWDACITAGGCTRPPGDQGWGRGRRPVINVSWQDAQQYISWLSEKAGNRYRLPSEAEWEYAARAGTSTTYYWGNEIGVGKANCKECGSQWDNDRTAPVGSFAPNPWGLYDMLGNVNQWTLDCSNESYNVAPDDGHAWSAGDCSKRVARGGGWNDQRAWVRAAYRWRPSASSGYTIGFRVARDD
jgi:formylglycine-generating enzyme required for sulfatase activity